MRKTQPPRKIYPQRFFPEGYENLKKVAKTANTTAVELLRRAVRTSYGVEL